MRTTLVLDDEIIHKARHRAIDLGVTLSELVNRCLERALDDDLDVKPERFRTLTYGGSGETEHVSPEEIRRIEEDDEIERFRRLR